MDLEHTKTSQCAATGIERVASSVLQPASPGKNWLLSKKMQNILLLNSENSIPECTPVEFQTVLSGCIRGTELWPGPGPAAADWPGAWEGGGSDLYILYNYRKGAIRVAGENADKKWIWCIEWWIFKFLYWKLPSDSTTVGTAVYFFCFFGSDRIPVSTNVCPLWNYLIKT